MDDGNQGSAGTMTGRALTIAQTADEIRNALREYIEATYHVGHPSLKVATSARNDLGIEES